ncbi:DUF6612 family protein [Paenibacillus sp. JJ-223]|uniref:DUF6612 family protein n=1 Tax=Paenibacillus sp. JJ-223 TaxID=2905647 RepID=UPI001F3DD2EB|nr:DUF6612 family protein [Paenibacillus sp. JJ-223]CAH1203467.1 hypothetical protein PAECIP111890_02240 [Paenibacillus sp. JJ-223]
MKKWATVLIGAWMALSLAACGGQAGSNDASKTAANNDPTSNNAAVNEQEAAVPTLDELIAKSSEASKTLKSFSSEASIQQNISVEAGEQSQEQQLTTSIKMDVIKDPLTAYQEMKVEMPGQEAQTIKQYFTNDSIYSQVGEQWVTIPEEQTQPLIEQMKASVNPEQELEQFKSITEDTKITAEGDNYIINATVSGDNVKELAKSVLQQNGTDPQMQTMIDQMDITSMTMKYMVNQETYLPTGTDLNMVMNMEQEGQKMKMDMKMTSTFSNHNTVENIEVPQEVLDSAK